MDCNESVARTMVHNNRSHKHSRKSDTSDDKSKAFSSSGSFSVASQASVVAVCENKNNRSSDASKDILYGDDEDAKVKARAVSAAFGTASPGVVHISEDGKLTPRQKSKSRGAKLSLEEDGRGKKKSSRRDRKSSSRRSTDSATSLLYGDEDAKTKGSSASSWSSPGVVDVSEDGIYNPRGKSSRSPQAVLYGDHDEKAKAKSSMGSTFVFPGVVSINEDGMVTPKSNRSVSCTLYGDEDKKAKLKGSMGSFLTSPGVVSISEDGMVTPKSYRSVASTLYGDEDEKAKLKGSRASTPGVVAINDEGSAERHNSRSPRTSRSPRSSRRSTTRSSRRSTRSSRTISDSSARTETSEDILYGNDEDAKAKASIGKATAPGVDRIEESAFPKPGDKGYVSDPLFASNEKPNIKSSRKLRGTPKSRDLSRRKMDRLALGDQCEESEDDMFVMEDKQKTFDNKKKEEAKSKKKGLLAMIYLCLLVLTAAGIGAYFALRNDDDDATGTQNANLEDPTTSPSFAPSKSRSPTSSPTFKQIYYPPKPEDCLAISKNRTIFGQNNLEQSEFGINLDVTLIEAGDISPIAVQVLLDAIQAKLLPKFAGCDQVMKNRRDLMKMTVPLARVPSYQRQLGIAGSRFVILNAFVMGSEDSETFCIEGSEMPLQCHRVVVELIVFLKGSIKFIDILNLIGDEVPIGTNLVFPLDLDVPFFDVKMVGVDILTPTAAP